ncbi:MAG TPA: hypothetical protein VFW65_23185 [Pseudonocardiaceae bacterium]|nr:hypothetical protein [Pseudonocardiaceae bacterium]
MTLPAAAGVVDVTPPLGPMAGYGARGDAAAVGVHDPLTASLLRLGGVCWVALDALQVTVPLASRVRTAVAGALGLVQDAVVVCASHTHSGPLAWLRDGPVADRLVADVAAGAGRLTEVPVTAHWAVVPDVGVGSNRYDPAGPHDASAGVLTLRDADGAVVAVLADYACHPTVLNHQNLTYSADYPAAARRVVRDAVGGVVLFLQGAAGDVSTRFTRRESSFAEADRHGGLLGEALLRGVAAGEPLAGAPTVRRGEVRVPTRALPDPATAATTLADAERAWLAVTDPTSPDGRITRTRYEGAQLQAALCAEGLPPSLTLPIGVVEFGDVAWAHLPVEPFTSYGERIRAAGTHPVTRTVGYTDGYFGYLADETAHRNGRYEALGSRFDPAAGDVVVIAAVDLL